MSDVDQMKRKRFYLEHIFFPENNPSNVAPFEVNKRGEILFLSALSDVW